MTNDNHANSLTVTWLWSANKTLKQHGSVSANGNDGADFAIFVQGPLRVTDASPAGHGVSKLRAEAIACFAGL